MNNTPCIFLDIDGVLNDHNPFNNGYSGLKPDCVELLCQVLKAIPETRIIISSAWRYLVFDGSLSLSGLEYIFLIHGAEYDAIHGKIIGVTPSEEEIARKLGICEPNVDLDYMWLKENGQDIRVLEIQQVIEDLNISNYVVVDDLNLCITNLVKTDPFKGLTTFDIQKIIEILK